MYEVCFDCVSCGTELNVNVKAGEGIEVKCWECEEVLVLDVELKPEVIWCDIK